MEDFKVGDKVIIKDLREFNHDESPFIVPQMYPYINTVQTISGILERIDDDTLYFLENNKYKWNALWLLSLKFDKEMWK